MDNQYPIRFLMDRARDIGYELTMEEAPAANQAGSDVPFRRPSSNVKRNTYILEWGKSLISFQPTLQVANQVAELTVRGWNPQTKKEIKVTVKRSGNPRHRNAQRAGGHRIRTHEETRDRR